MRKGKRLRNIENELNSLWTAIGQEEQRRREETDKLWDATEDIDQDLEQVMDRVKALEPELIDQLEDAAQERVVAGIGKLFDKPSVFENETVRQGISEAIADITVPMPPLDDDPEVKPVEMVWIPNNGTIYKSELTTPFEHQLFDRVIEVTNERRLSVGKELEARAQLAAVRKAIDRSES